MNHLRDEFLSEEDLDLRHASRETLYAHWDWWLEQAQATNARDRRAYSHGVFVLMEEPERNEKLRQVTRQPESNHTDVSPIW